MNKNKILANIILLFHLSLVFVIVFGWYFPAIKYWYLAALVLTLLSELILGYCILTKWEFDLRKKIDPTFNYDYAFLRYYAHKIGIEINRQKTRFLALIFLLGSLIIFYARTFIYS